MPPRIARVVLRNYRSIAACDVSLPPLAFLVGPNGSGKSNFLHALRFTANSLATSLDQAIRDRGGVSEVRRRSTGHPTHFGIRLDLALAEHVAATYAFEIGAQNDGAFLVEKERCDVTNGSGVATWFQRDRDQVSTSVSEPLPATQPDRLLLVAASGLPAFRKVFDFLSRIEVYNINPDQMRELQPPGSPDLLLHDGRNIASVVDRLEKHEPEVKKRVEEYLGKIVPGLLGFERKTFGHRESLEFAQRVEGARHPWRFNASNMSDGTLRCLALLVASFQRSDKDRSVSTIGVEEPETALHPAAAGVLRDALREAALHRQIIVTSHSPELLDSASIREEELVAVTSIDNDTKLGAVDPATREALRRHLFTPGELLRAGQIAPDAAARELQPEQLRLFDTENT